jgi:hypothetical protein
MRDDRGQQHGVGGGVLPLGELLQVGDRGGRGVGVARGVGGRVEQPEHGLAVGHRVFHASICGASCPSNAGSGTAILLDDEGDAPEQIRHHHIS